MKMDITVERVYPRPLEAVWRAVTEREALGQWLMETDFVAEIGRAFTMQCQNPAGGTDRYLGRVVALQPMSRMVWSWVLESDPAEREMFVEFQLEAVDEGTRLTIRHSGEQDAAAIDAFKGGWPGKLGQLESVLSKP